MMNLKRFILGAVFPAFLSIVLFFIAIFVIMIPAMEKSVMEQKQEMIRELTNSAWNVLANFEHSERANILSREEAQKHAIEQIQNLHYGQQMKDYFWVNDMSPKMVIHPYRPDLNGKSLAHFCDPQGKKLFVEVVKIAKEYGAGYVEYMWQWKDDPKKILPKISYIKAFEPWGWVIGTGVYLDDVQREIDSLKHRLFGVTLSIFVIVALLLVYLLSQAFKAEKERGFAEKRLKKSEEKYRLLVESAVERILMILEDSTLFANQSMLSSLGYSSQDIALLKPEDIWEEFPKLLNNISGMDTLKINAFLKTKEGQRQEVLLSLSKIAIQGKKGLIVVATDISKQREKELHQNRLIGELKSTLSFFEQESSRVCDRDLSQYAVPQSPITIPGQSLLFEAYRVSESNEFEPVWVTDSDQKIMGVLTVRHFMQLQQYSPVLFHREIQSSCSFEGLAKVVRRLATIAVGMMESGTRQEHSTRFITTTSDLVLIKCIQMAEKELGEAPVKYAFIVMGSQGRWEQTLCTDQDNAIIFQDVPIEKLDAVKSYFLKLGEKVTFWLDQMGYSFCPGKIMARESSCCQSLSEWINQFQHWTRTLEGEDLLNSKIFFDFRCVYGEQEFIHSLRASLYEDLQSNPRFFFFMARNVLQFTPPLDFFHSFSLKTIDSHRKVFDIKGVVAQIVDYARIYSLKHGIHATNTLERLELLKQKGILSEQNFQEISIAYQALMEIRLRHQSIAIKKNYVPDNFIDPNKLTSIEQKTIKEAFIRIKDFQLGLSYDFTGMA
ncbi:MAG: cache domain-containing protein [Candidatus Brocadiae bacterium]|nr:cache domain-containing protein [Candidatus Brocadiia bacterium]